MGYSEGQSWALKDSQRDLRANYNGQRAGQKDQSEDQRGLRTIRKDMRVSQRRKTMDRCTNRSTDIHIVFTPFFSTLSAIGAAAKKIEFPGKKRHFVYKN